MKHALVQSVILIGLFASLAVAKPDDSPNVGERNWGSVHSMVSLGGKIYAGGSGGLWVIEKNGKARAVVPKVEGWGRISRLTALNGRLYCISEENLYEVDPSGKARKLSDEWRAVLGMAALDGKLYIISSNEFYEVDPGTGKYVSLSEDWYNVGGMTEVNGKLYVLRRDKLEELDKSGRTKAFEGDFNSHALIAADGKLYFATTQRTKPGDNLINESILESFDPKSKTRTRLSSPKGWDRGTGVEAMAVLDGKLYVLQPNSRSRGFLSLDLK